VGAGYVGRILLADLSRGTVKVFPPDERMCREYLGGYALGARLIWDWQPPGVDPLGPENVLGFVTGPLTGTPAIIGSRYMVVGKSPLTGTWGDANSGGSFGPGLRAAGFDAVFLVGRSERPVYLLLQQGRAELRDARQLWGLETDKVEDALQAELGAGTEVASIGPAGENRSLISGIVNNKGRAAARSGLGALMGSKCLKAIAVQGDQPVPLADEARVRELRKHYLAKLTGPAVEYYRNYGTCGGVAGASVSGDAPVKNWQGAGPVDFPNAPAISDDNVIRYQERRYACWQCPLGCGGHVRAVYRAEPIQGHKPEYETLAAFGSMTLVDDLEAIIQANNLCNAYGLDTISTGATIAFAMECFQEGLLPAGLTAGLDLGWGNAAGMLALITQMAHRQGLGGLLADGVRKAVEGLGPAADSLAVHIQGQELPMHDPRYLPTLAISYWLDATPGRHTQGGHWAYELPAESKARLGIPANEDRYAVAGKAAIFKKVADIIQTVNISGLCQFGYEVLDVQHVPDFLSAVTGWDITLDECLVLGERAGTLRHLFNLREGLNPLEFRLPDRALGRPPLTTGALAGVEVDVRSLAAEYLAVRDWDPVSAMPSQAKLAALGLGGLASSLPRR